MIIEVSVMSAAKRISKEAIIDAAAAVLRIGGFEAINAAVWRRRWVLHQPSICPS